MALRRLINHFSSPLRRLTNHFSEMLRRLNNHFSDSLRRLTNHFSDPFTLICSAKSANLKVRGVEIKLFTLCVVFRRLLSFKHKTFYLSDRVPLYCFQHVLKEFVQMVKSSGKALGALINKLQHLSYQ